MAFSKGDPNINRTGKTNPAVRMLHDAIEAEGINRGETFWQMIAKTAFKDKNVMIAVLKKFVPDTSITTLEGDIGGGTKVIIVKEKDAAVNRNVALPTTLP